VSHRAGSAATRPATGPTGSGSTSLLLDHPGALAGGTDALAGAHQQFGAQGGTVIEGTSITGLWSRSCWTAAAESDEHADHGGCDHLDAAASSDAPALSLVPRCGSEWAGS
jgi:hypothetical protein